MKTIFLGVLVSLALVQSSLSVPQKRSSRVNADTPLAWWKQSVVYQIYPRSFQDSDGDGIGDLNGITSRLDYFVELGIDAIWISPIMESPMKDFGYDISNFTNIDPLFGNLDDFKRMAEEFRKRGIKLIMDMVPNHSSDEHEYFKKSVQRVDPYTDYYVWRNASGIDADGKPIPPNNWVSVFSGSAWQWNEERQQFYLHQFVKEQPDFDYENNDVRNDVLSFVKFWLDMGVDGFRVDAVPWIYEDQRMLDEPADPNAPPGSIPDEYRYWNHMYTYNLPGVPMFLADMRQLLDVYDKADGRVRCMMVEANVADEFIDDYYGTPDKPVSHFPFNFHLLQVNAESTATAVLDLINVWFEQMPDHAWPTFLLGNHDQKRAPTRWGEGGIDGANMINLLLQGTAITYQGEEIGQTDTFLTWEETVDPQACNTDPERYHEFSRDPARTPFHWDNGTGAGFSSSNKTWLPLNPNYITLNLAAQKAAEESHYKVYKELLKLRQTEAWRYGSYEGRALSNDRILAFSRIPSKESNATGFVVLFNLSNDVITVDTSSLSGVPLFATVRIRSVGFQGRGVIVGGAVYTPSVELGSKDSLVLEFTPLY